MWTRRQISACQSTLLCLSGDDNLAKKEFGKINNYGDIRLELRRKDIKNTTALIPVVIYCTRRRTG